MLGYYQCYQEGLSAVKHNKPLVILLEYNEGNISMELFIASLLRECPTSKIILLGENLRDEDVLCCLLSGIYGYLDVKDMYKFQTKAVKAVANGEAWISRRLVALLIEGIRG
ncbi:transcriptional regulator [Methyloprofundus sedimenti]|nr:DNA-binding response regulator [Methyloprofundus sedimenti]